MQRKSERVEFTGSTGNKLAGRLEQPADEPSAYAIFAHCFTCGKDVFAAARISTALAERGIAVLRFDFTGLGNSEGDFANTDFSSNVEDLVAAAAHLRNSARAPALLVGHSLGGAAVLAAAAKIPEVRAVATLAAPAEPAHVKGLLRGSIEEIEAEGAAEVLLAGRPFTIRKSFLDDVSESRLAPAIGALERALLVFHSPVDELVDIDHARRIYEAARHPKSFVAIDGADHLLTRRRDAEFVADLLCAWAQRYVTPEN